MCLITTDPGALLASPLCVIKITDDEEPYMPLVHMGRSRGGRESHIAEAGYLERQGDVSLWPTIGDPVLARAVCGARA